MDTSKEERCKYEVWDEQRGEYICSNILTDCGANCAPCLICCLYEKAKAKTG